MQIWAESGKSALPICNYSQILYQFLTFTQNLKRSHHRVYIIDFCYDIIHMCADEAHAIFLGISHLISFYGFNHRIFFGFEAPKKF